MAQTLKEVIMNVSFEDLFISPKILGTRLNELRSIPMQVDLANIDKLEVYFRRNGDADIYPENAEAQYDFDGDSKGYKFTYVEGSLIIGSDSFPNHYSFHAAPVPKPNSPKR